MTNNEFFRMENHVYLIDLANFCKRKIAAAEKDGLIIDDGTVVDFIADNSNAPLATIRSALVVAGLRDRFPFACREANHTGPRL